LHEWRRLRKQRNWLEKAYLVSKGVELCGDGVVVLRRNRLEVLDELVAEDCGLVLGVGLGNSLAANAQPQLWSGTISTG
jgi:hypothetical protein